MYKAGDEGWEDLTQERAWDEPEAVRLLQEAGERVAGFETTGARVPQRQRYHARLVAAHDARDMAAYRLALNGYVEAAREAYRKAKAKKGGGSGAP
jgi:DNA-binding FadR family transcriptional regulator